MISLNLIPREKKDVIKQEVLFDKIKRITIHIGIFIFIVLILLVGARYILDYYHQEISENIAKISNTSNEEDFKVQVKKLNNELAFIKQVQEDHQPITSLMLHLLDLIPNDVTLKNTVINTEAMSFDITGVALKRKDLINLEDALNASPVFSNVMLPFSSLVLKENIEFEISTEFDSTKIEINSNE